MGESFTSLLYIPFSAKPHIISQRLYCIGYGGIGEMPVVVETLEIRVKGCIIRRRCEREIQGSNLCSAVNSRVPKPLG